MFEQSRWIPASAFTLRDIWLSATNYIIELTTKSVVPSIAPVT